MGNCNSRIDCSACSLGGCDRQIDAEPDIVGPGVSSELLIAITLRLTYSLKVLASFSLTAVITVASVIYGYFYECFPEWYLNEVDTAILAEYRTSWVSTKFIPRVEDFCFWLIHLVRTALRLPDKPRPSRIDREERTEALARFILALSDQQLVTGLAILVGALGSRCTLSAYEFLVVVSLSWFSSTTHLATLDVLREYFIKHQVVRNIRVIGMVIMMILLLFGLLVEGGYYEYSPATPMQCVIKPRIVVPNIALSSAFTILFLVYSYVDRIGRLFDDQHDESFPPYSNRERLLRLVMRICHRRLNVNAVDYKRITKEVVFERQAKRKKVALDRVNLRATKTMLLFSFKVQRYYSSFLSSIPVSLFGLSYGITQVSVSRWLVAPDITEDANKMSFGQIVPLFLLLLPGLAAAEIYYGISQFTDDSLRIKLTTTA